MAHYSEFFRGKRVTVLGLGLLGRAVGDAEFIAQQDARVTVTDAKGERELKASVERLAPYENVVFHLGGESEQDFLEADMVIKAAGVPLDSRVVALARGAGVPVYMSTALAARFAREAGARIVGVTGTRGKSTVAHMIHHALAAAGKRAHLGGNVRGVSTLALVPDIRPEDVLVLELDSWQLQGFGDLNMSPDIAVFTNLMPDHQNYYPDMESYFADKANIFWHQGPDDLLFVGSEIAPRIHSLLKRGRVCTPAPLPDSWKLGVPGAHNRVNAALAACVLSALGLAEPEVRDGLASFAGVEGRLQFVREAFGVKIYNDNNATTPEASVAALQALDTGGANILLIAGGADKGLSMDGLVEEIGRACKKVFLLEGTGTERIRSALPQAPVFDSLDAAFRAAMDAAAPGDILLFSPSFASFGLFSNEYERNDRFLHLARAL